MVRMPQKHFQVEDLYLHQKVTELDAAPDGQAVACTVRSIDREANDYQSCIWSLSLNGNKRTQLTRGPGKDQSPRWSPDGDELAFISNRGGSPQVYLLPADGGEARQLSKLAGAVSDLRWTPDGKGLLVTSSVAVDPDWRGQRANGRKPAQPKVQP